MGETAIKTASGNQGEKMVCTEKTGNLFSCNIEHFTDMEIRTADRLCFFYLFPPSSLSSSLSLYFPVCEGVEEPDYFYLANTF